MWCTPGDSKAGNLAAVGAASLPTWSTEQPTQSVTQGAGGGYVTAGPQRQVQQVPDPTTGALFKGTFTGDLDNLAVTMYLFSPGRDSAAGWYAGIDVVVDGTTLVSTDTDGVPLSSGGNAVQKIDFAVGKLDQAMTEAGPEKGPDVEHEVELLVSSFALVGTTAALVYGHRGALVDDVQRARPRGSLRALTERRPQR